MSDADLDRLLAGKAPLGGVDGTGLADFVRDLKAQYLVEPPPAVREAHIAQMLSAARLHNDHRQPLVTPARTAGRSARQGWRRYAVLSSLFGSMTAKILAGVVAASAATGGLAAAGALPGPVQNAVASAAGSVGVNLPNPQAAHTDANKVASTVSTLVQQATTAAATPGTFSSAAVAVTGACSQNVSTIAGQLAGGAAQGATASGAQSLAARATALAQEALGCAIPSTTTGASVSTSGHQATVTGTVAPDPDSSAIGKAIAASIQQCSAPLKAAIQTLVQAALSARSPSQIQTLAADAKALAAAAQTCAQGIEAAIKANLPAVPTSTATGGTGIPGTSGKGNLGGVLGGILSNLPTSLPKLPTVTVTPPAASGGTGSVTLPTTMDPAAWLKLLAQLPTGGSRGAAPPPPPRAPPPATGRG